MMDPGFLPYVLLAVSGAEETAAQAGVIWSAVSAIAAGASSGVSAFTLKYVISTFKRDDNQRFADFIIRTNKELLDLDTSEYKDDPNNKDTWQHSYLNTLEVIALIKNHKAVDDKVAKIFEGTFKRGVDIINERSDKEEFKKHFKEFIELCEKEKWLQ